MGDNTHFTSIKIIAKNIFQKGFTLIELLVVISIISSLSSVSLTAVSNARSKARDSVRLQYVRQIDQAIQRYTWDNGGHYPPQDYPIVGPNGGFSYSTDPTFISALVTKNYVSLVPLDPLNNYAKGYMFRYLNNDGNIGGLPLPSPLQNDAFASGSCINTTTGVRAVFEFYLEGKPSPAYDLVPGLPVNSICYK